MNRAIATIAAATSCLLAGCMDLSDPVGSRKTEQHIADRCRAWDVAAYAAAHPDAAALARHAKQVAHIAELRAAHADIATIVQAEIDADMVADLRNKEQGAASCWAMLGVIKQTHYEMEQRMLEAAEEIDSQPMARFAPNPADYTLGTHPPAAPSPSPPSALGDLYAPPPSPPPVRFIPYDAVAPTMPGIGPSGTPR